MSIDKLDQLVFVGFNGYAAALDRDTGEIVWSNNDMKSGYVTLLLDGDRLIVSTNGYMFCLDPYTGRTMWHNPMVGYGYGPTSIASTRGNSGSAHIAHAAAAQAQAAAGAAASGAAAS
jgi:outer membrane protein assembly factor BamB